jgi:phospholipase D-like protein
MSRVARLYLLLIAVEVVLAIAALISCLSADEGEVSALPRIAWVLIILFFPLLGSIAWFAVGRSRPRPADTWRVGGGFPEPERPRPVAPDDDPAFLRSLQPERRQDEDLLGTWEEDLRRREEELRRQRAEPAREDDPPAAPA